MGAGPRLWEACRHKNGRQFVRNRFPEPASIMREIDSQVGRGPVSSLLSLFWHRQKLLI